MKKRFFYINLFFLFLFLLLFFSSAYIQIIKGPDLRRLSEKNRIRVVQLLPDRGMIFDAKGVPLAVNSPSFSVSIVQVGLSKDDIDRAIETLSSVLKIDRKDAYSSIRKKALRPFEPAIIASGLKKEDILKIASLSLDIPGLSISADSVRRYPQCDLACHLIGYVGKISKDEFEEKNGYSIDDRIGKVGLEKFYEDVLRGVKGGEQTEVDAKGRMVRSLGRKEPVPGANLYLTIDSDIQRIARDALEGNIGSVVVLDPRDGAILALVSRPGFNPNIFVRGLTVKEARRLFFSQARPMLNRAIQAQYPPGSLFKIIDAYIALEKEAVEPTDRFRCDGIFKVGERRFCCFAGEEHGFIQLTSALAHSCNIYFYQLGVKVGAEALIRAATRFRLGKKTFIDLPYEEEGSIPTPSWKERIFGLKWYQGDTVNLSIGQGYLLVTPLQTAVLVSAIANGGKIFRPYIVKRIEYADGRVKEKVPILEKTISISHRTKEILDRGLCAVIEHGTGKKAYIPDIKIAGKTGTAQNPHGKDHAWFVCYAPVEDPQVVVVVLVEHGGRGGVDAAPIAKRILEKVL